MTMAQLIWRPAACVLVVCSVFYSLNSYAQDVNERYMYRVPDWLWTQQMYTAMISNETRKELEYDIKILNTLGDLDDDTAYKEKNDEIARKLSGLLALRDLTAVATTVENHTQGTKLALQIDTAFSDDARHTIRHAGELFLSVALDDSVIRKSIDSSIKTPAPMPEMYEMADGSSKKDEFGNKVYTPSYAFYVRQRHMPNDIESFKKHFQQALSTSTGDPALLIISQYTGNVWWGGGYYNFYHKDVQQLARLRPSRGFIYIRLNSDKLTKGEAHYDDPVFWASKIAHEVLHNIGYWHPSYKNPEHRDMHNQGKAKAFIVAYENEVYAKLMANKGK